MDRERRSPAQLTWHDPIEDFTAEIGVLFIDFHVDGDPYKARGYFKNLAGEMIDEFEIYAAH